jgi:quercetin dioxygenase-like cupin family protein
MRRVVTARAADGASSVVVDGPSSRQRPGTPAGVTLTDLWASDGSPRLPFNGADAALNMPLLPQPGGTCFRVVQIEPGHGMEMHSSDTVDYLVILDGRVCLRVEGKAEVVLERGDCLVQLGAVHAWENRDAQPCVMVAVVVGAMAPV